MILEAKWSNLNTLFQPPSICACSFGAGNPLFFRWNSFMVHWENSPMFLLTSSTFSSELMGGTNISHGQKNPMVNQTAMDRDLWLHQIRLPWSLKIWCIRHVIVWWCFLHIDNRHVSVTYMTYMTYISEKCVTWLPWHFPKFTTWGTGDFYDDLDDPRWLDGYGNGWIHNYGWGSRVKRTLRIAVGGYLGGSSSVS